MLFLQCHTASALVCMKWSFSFFFSSQDYTLRSPGKNLDKFKHYYVLKSHENFLDYKNNPCLSSKALYIKFYNVPVNIYTVP
jgi:hypothetical protein